MGEASEGSATLLGAPRAAVDVSRGPNGLRIEVPTRRTRRSWLLGLPALVVGGLLSLAYTVVLGYTAVSSGADFAISLFVLLVGLFLSVFFHLGPSLGLTLYGAYSLFGWIVAEIRDDGVTVRKRVWRLHSPAIIVIRDAPQSIRAINTERDVRGRMLVSIRWRGGGARTESVRGFGAGYLSDKQAHEIADIMRDAVGMSLSGDSALEVVTEAASA